MPHFVEDERGDAARSSLHGPRRRRWHPRPTACERVAALHTFAWRAVASQRPAPQWRGVPQSAAFLGLAAKRFSMRTFLGFTFFTGSGT